MDRRDRDAGPDGSADRGERGRPSHALGRELREKFRHKDAKPEDLKKQIGEWKEARGKRRDEHRRLLVERWGPALTKADVAGELELHARRLARLQRMEELVATDRKGDERTRLLDKIDKLREKEKQRHEQAMQRLTTGQAAAAASASAQGAPSAAPNPARAAGGGTP